MRFALLACLLLSGRFVAAGQANVAPTSARQQPEYPPELRAALGIDPLVDRLRALQTQGQGASLEALTVRQQALERILTATFQIDDALGRIDTEASYCNEDGYVLQVHNQRQANALNLVTFAASGALGAAGSAMQLTHGLNHAGTALQAAAGGTSLVLSAVQLKTGGGRQPVRTPYNMLAEVLDRQPNAESQYPPLVMDYLRAPRTDGRSSVLEGLTGAWRRLDRLKGGSKGNGASVEDLVADRASNAKLTSDELADREAMLHDLHANIVLLRSDLQRVLQTVVSTE